MLGNKFNQLITSASFVHHKLQIFFNAKNFSSLVCQPKFLCKATYFQLQMYMLLVYIHINMFAELIESKCNFSIKVVSQLISQPIIQYYC